MQMGQVTLQGTNFWKWRAAVCRYSLKILSTMNDSGGMLSSEAI